MNLFTNLYWREPLWLFLILLPLVIYLIQQLGRKRWRQQWAQESLRPWLESTESTRPGLHQRAIFLVAWLLLVIALCGPRTPLILPPALVPPTAEVVFITDLSGSMVAKDALFEGQLMRRRDAAAQLAQRWSNQSGRTLKISILVFAGDPHWLLPASEDPALRTHFLAQLGALQPPTLGNSLGAALTAAAQSFSAAAQSFSAQSTSHHLLLFTDGDIESEQQQRAAQALTELRENDAGLKLHLIGIGSSEASRLGDGNVTRLESRWLRQVAQESGGTYLNLEQASRLELSELLALPTPRIAPEVHEQLLWREWFALPLVAAIALVLLGFRMAERAAHRGNRDA